MTLLLNVAAGMQTSPRIFFEFWLVQWSVASFGESVGLMLASFARSMGLNVS